MTVPTRDSIIDATIIREGGEKVTNHAADRGRWTKFGITQKTLGEADNLGRDATPEEIKHLSVARARAIYADRYLDGPGFGVIADGYLLEAVFDDAVNVGPQTATRHLQMALKVPADGVMGPVTRKALGACNPELVITELTKARCLYYAQIVKHDPTQAVFLVGWLSRALSFL